MSAVEPTDPEYSNAVGRIEAHPTYIGRPQRTVTTDALAYRWLVSYHDHYQKMGHEDAIRQVENENLRGLDAAAVADVACAATTGPASCAYWSLGRK